MVKNRTRIKQRLIDYNNHSADEYHEVNYPTRGSYSPLWLRQYYIERKVEAESVPAGSKILDVGCGPGGLVLSLAKKGRHDCSHCCDAVSRPAEWHDFSLIL